MRFESDELSKWVGLFFFFFNFLGDLVEYGVYNP